MNALHKLALAALTLAYGLGPMATQIVTPAIPFVHHDMHVSMATAQMLVSLAFITIAMATLVFGPVSDRYGRRPVLLAGTALFCVGSIVAALAPNPAVLIVGRMIQAAGSSAGLALSRTIIHDVYGREGSSRIIAYLTTVMIFVPMLAPVAGGILLDVTNWRMVFAVCVLFGIVALTLLAWYLPETNRARRCDLDLRGTFRDFTLLLRDPRYVAPAIFFSAIMSMFFASQAAIPYLMVDILHRSATEYGLWFAACCIAYVLGNYLTARMGDRVPRHKLILASGAGSLLTVLAGFIVATMTTWSTAILFTPVVVLGFVAAVAVAPVQAEAVSAQPDRSGSASGLMTSVQMIFGASVVQAVGFSHDGTPYPMYAALLSCGLVAVFAAVSIARSAKHPGGDVMPGTAPAAAN